MDKILVVVDTHNAIIEQLNDLVDERLDDKEREAFKGFIAQYFHRYPIKELNGLELNDVYGRCYELWRYLQHRDLSTPKVRVFNPSLEEDGWLCGHTVVAVLQRDMPFLVDSIRMEVNRRNIAIHAINSTVFTIARDKAHQLVELAPREAKVHNSKNKIFGKEALTYLEVNLHTSEAEIFDLASAINAVLEDVSTVVDDYQPLMDQIEEVAKNLDLGPKKMTGDTLLEAQAFIHWLADGHFTFMGYSEYEFFDNAYNNGEKTLRELPEKRLGLFKQRNQDRVGGGITPAVLSHHRAYGSVPRRFTLNI